jgi:carbon storage regulator CsrA
MLILSRLPNEALVIGGGRVVVRVLGWAGSQVRIGIEADPSIPIDREEVHVRKQREAELDTRAAWGSR